MSERMVLDIMRGSSITYFFKSAFKSMGKNALMSLASVFVLLACMLIIGSAYVASANINSFLTHLEDQNEIVAFVEDEYPVEQITELRDELEAIPGVYEAVFISKEQALAEYRSSFDSDQDFFEGFDGEDNPLRNEFRIKISNIEDFFAISQKIANMEHIANIRNSQQVVDTLISVRGMLDLLGFWIMIVLAVVSLFIISNTIKLAMHNRRVEINIMKYVGATNWFIRWPFVLEGLIIGVISSVIALSAQWLMYVYLIKPLIMNISFIAQSVIPFRDMFSGLVFVFVGIGVMVGVFGSLFSIRRYLKV